ncbi:MAG TPA: alpha/beta hydrolase [Rhizomicrobium sp.]|jgi:pimeloyl-ACP methyl ester carboxylesterase|nr:alpha/beta hydrolase [Rhizomicrobium sp.]
MTEFAESPDGLRIAYETSGDGDPVLLIHGFASSRVQNWRANGWYKTLNDSGYRTIALDCRGHGESDKPHNPSFYTYEKMAADALAVLKAAGCERAYTVGYSMGGHIGIEILMTDPQAIRKLAIAGVGERYLKGQFDARFEIAEAILEDDVDRIVNPVARGFRVFAGQPGKDRVALAACMRGNRRAWSAADLARAARPVLVLCGEKDETSGAPGPLAAAFADARSVVVPGRDHMSAVGDKMTKEAVLAFLGEEGTR